jgi:hypothetical protein
LYEKLFVKVSSCKKSWEKMFATGLNALEALQILLVACRV